MSRPRCTIEARDLKTALQDACQVLTRVCPSVTQVGLSCSLSTRGVWLSRCAGRVPALGGTGRADLHGAVLAARRGPINHALPVRPRAADPQISLFRRGARAKSGGGRQHRAWVNDSPTAICSSPSDRTDGPGLGSVERRDRRLGSYAPPAVRATTDMARARARGGRQRRAVTSEGQYTVIQTQGSFSCAVMLVRGVA